MVAFALCTALAAYLLFKQPFDRHTWWSVGIMLAAIALMSYLMSRDQQSHFGLGDILFVMSAIWWEYFYCFIETVEALHGIRWRASRFGQPLFIYRFTYYFFLKHYHEVEPLHLAIQGLFHGVFVVIVATITYVAAIERLGAFKTGSIVTLALLLPQ